MGKPVQIFMPVADGSLRDYPSTKMEKKEVVLVSKQIVSALQYLHEKGMCTEISNPRTSYTKIVPRG